MRWRCRTARARRHRAVRWCVASVYKAPLTSSYRGLSYSDPFGLCPGPPCWHPYNWDFSWSNLKRWFTDAWSGRAAGTGPAKASEVGYDAAMIAGAPGNGMVVRGAAAAVAGAAAASTAGVGVGTKVYRVYGGDSKQMGYYWTTVNPNATSNYAAKAGLPLGNKMESVVEGVITDATGITTTTAAPGAHGPGGMPEVQIPDAATRVKVVKAPCVRLVVAWPA